MNRRFAAFSLIAMLAAPMAAPAAEPPAAAFTLDTDVPKDLAADPLDKKPNKTAFNNAKPDVRVALCGVEADAGNANLDAGLVDFNIPTSAHGTPTWSEGPRDAGRNVHDYPSPVFLGVTLGYRF